MLVNRFEPAMDAIILVLVEVLQLLGLIGGMIEGDGTVAISFPGSVGTNEFQLAASL